MPDLVSPSAPTAWICPGCDRQVPRHIDTCYCGGKRPKEPVRSWRPAVQGDGGLGPVVKLSVAGVAVVLLGLGAWYSSRGVQPITPAAPSTAPAARPQAAARTPVAAFPASSSDAPDASAPPLEEMVEHAMPAVVLVEAAGSRGSGFFAAPDLIVTSAHVLSRASSAAITARNGSRMEGTVVFVSEQRDLAFLQIPRQSAQDVALPLGRSAEVRLGQSVTALGWAQSMTQSTVTRGVVTGLRRDGERLLLQTDAVPHPGDSGGPVLDRRGAVVGITTLRADNGTAGFALAIDEAKPFLERVPPNNSSAPASAPTPSPAAAAPAAPTPAAGPSAMDARRAIGLQHYDDALTSIERASADLDANWNYYRTSCRITSVPGGQSHEWFTLYDPRSPLHSTAASCADVLAGIEQRARAVNASMAAAAELARQSGVYASELRPLRARHRLDYAGWDR